MKKNGFGFVLKIFGVIFLSLGIVIALSAAAIIPTLPDALSGLMLLLPATYLFGVTFILFLIFFGAGTVICLLADIEFNTRKLKK